jgi:hypothetical protein
MMKYHGTRIGKRSSHFFVNLGIPIATSLSFSFIASKEDIKEQPTSRNLSATATRVL